MQSLWLYFTDPVLRGPTVGCMLMCVAAALVGVLVLLRKQSLIGETLAHATYPGVILGVLAVAPWMQGESSGNLLAVGVLIGASCSALAGLWSIEALRKYAGIRSDAALCFVLASFFGVGLTMASRLQFSHTRLYVQIQQYLYGQAATMTDQHVVLYALLALLIAILVVLFYKELQVITFDREFAKSLGVPTTSIDNVLFLLVVLAVVVGIRSVGVVLMSAMLIAPAAAARQFTNRLSILLVLASAIGAISGFLGNYLASELSVLLVADTGGSLGLPTGPMIVLVATALTVLSLLFAPERGLLLRLWRIARFRWRCTSENVLKNIWRDQERGYRLHDLARHLDMSRVQLQLILWQLKGQGWIERSKRGGWQLTEPGRVWAAQIVRLHRLWELYLTDCLGMGVERVHRSAEEMEHIITPEIEERLTRILDNPTTDPHHQPIPPREGNLA